MKKIIFSEGDVVVLNKGFLDTPVGTKGKILCSYFTEPTSYEILFYEGTEESFSIDVIGNDIDPVL